MDGFGLGLSFVGPNQDRRRRGPLSGHQAVVDAIFVLQQLAGRALFDQLAALEHDDAVRVGHARKTVGDDQRGAAALQMIERLLDGRFVFRVNTRQGFVQHQDRCVLEQRAGDGQALALPARQAHAALTDERRVAIGQLENELMRVGGAARRLQLLRCGPRPRDVQVVSDAAIKQVRVLRNHGDLASQHVDRQVAQVVSVEQHATLLRIDEAQQQVDQRGLARARRPDHTQAPARLQLERHVGESRASAAGIAKRHVVEPHNGLQLRGRARRGRRLHLGDRVEQLVQPARGGDGQHAAVKQLDQVTQRAEHFDAQQQDHQQRGERQLASLDTDRAPTECDRRPRGNAQQRDTAGGDVDPEHPHRAAVQVAGARREPLAALAALPERLERREALDVVKELGGGVGLRATEGHARRAVQLVESRRRDQRHQREDQEDGRRLQVQKRHEAENHDRREHGDDQLWQVLAEKGIELFDAVD